MNRKTKDVQKFSPSCRLVSCTCVRLGFQATTSRGHEVNSNMAVADVVIKQEAVDAVDLEARVVQLCKENPKGITDQIISQGMPNIPPQQRVTAINRLLSMVSHSIAKLSLRIYPYYFLFSTDMFDIEKLNYFKGNSME